MLTLDLSALFQRLWSQRGGHRQQDRASDGELQRCALSPAPSPVTPRVLCPGVYFPLPGGCSAQGGGGSLPTGVPTPHPSAKAELFFVCDRREAHWLQLLRSAQGARVDMKGDFRSLGFPELGSLGAPELQARKSQGRGGGWRVLLDAKRPERWQLRELCWMSTEPWPGFQGWGGEG